MQLNAVSQVIRIGVMGLLTVVLLVGSGGCSSAPEDLPQLESVTETIQKKRAESAPPAAIGDRATPPATAPTLEREETGTGSTVTTVPDGSAAAELDPAIADPEVRVKANVDQMEKSLKEKQTAIESAMKEANEKAAAVLDTELEKATEAFDQKLKQATEVLDRTLQEEAETAFEEIDTQIEQREAEVSQTFDEIETDLKTEAAMDEIDAAKEQQIIESESP